MKTKLILLTFIALFIGEAGFCCTTFVLKGPDGKISFGRNLDFPVGEGHIHINYRNMVKTTYIAAPEKPMTWVSKYGSVTFNQAGREFPYGGMNEAGLVIEQMWLQEAKYPAADDRYGMNELQWMQYQLDNSASVKDVIDSDSLVRITYMPTSFLHFLVSDASGDVAVIEYLDGKMVVHRGEQLPYSVLANCIYENSLEYKSSKDQKEGKQYNDWTENSSGRFVTAASMIEAYRGSEDRIDYSYSILESVAQPGGTKWSIVYDISNKVIYYRTELNPVRQMIDLKKIDFSCNDQSLYVPMSEMLSEGNGFRALTYEDNVNLFRTLKNGVDFLKDAVPEEAVEGFGRYFETIKCK